MRAHSLVEEAKKVWGTFSVKFECSCLEIWFDLILFDLMLFDFVLVWSERCMQYCVQADVFPTSISMILRNLRKKTRNTMKKIQKLILPKWSHHELCERAWPTFGIRLTFLLLREKLALWIVETEKAEMRSWFANPLLTHITFDHGSSFFKASFPYVALGHLVLSANSPRPKLSLAESWFSAKLL